MIKALNKFDHKLKILYLKGSRHKISYILRAYIGKVGKGHIFAVYLNEKR
jgi:hypothetical protein